MGRHAAHHSRHRWRRLSSVWKALLASLLLAVAVQPAFAESEASVKAAYLFNFAKFVEWPTTAFESAKSPIIIGIVGRDAVSEELSRNFARATANGRALEIRRVSANSARELRACHIVFVPADADAESIIATVQAAPVLVVGESEGFARRGGALGFVKQGETLKFEANPKAAARNGVTVSSKLLRVAQGVVGK